MSETEENLQQQQPNPARPADLSVDAFRAELDVFSGPLDLLLYLIRQDEVDVLEIPVARITDQYLGALRTMQIFDVNVAAEFLVMAATLMDIKSRTLLPEAIEEEGEEADPRDELVRQLLQYKRFKQLAGRLEERAGQRARRFDHVPREPDADPEPISVEKLLEDVGIWDLVSAYAEVIRQIEMSQPHQIVYDDVPIADYMDEVLGRLVQDGRPVDFLEFLNEDPSRPRVIGVFLALLELVRRRRVALQQDEEERTQIRIARLPDPPPEEEEFGPGEQEPQPRQRAAAETEEREGAAQTPAEAEAPPASETEADPGEESDPLAPADAGPDAS